MTSHERDRAKYIDSTTWLLANKLMWWRRLHKLDLNLPTRFCGDSVRFGWPVIADSLTSKSIVYSFGIGTDASFEEQVLKTFGCHVYAFDPTPKSVDWIRGRSFGSYFHFFEMGIAETDGELEFVAPANPDDISYSALPQSVCRPTVRARVSTLHTIMRQFGHDSVDLLKMDIEGCEYKVLANLALTPLRPKQLLVEFHQGFYGCTKEMTMDSVKMLRNIGYRIFWVSNRGLEYGFVYNDVN